MVRKIAVLLHGEIDHDYRVIKTCKTLATHFEIDVYYVGVPTQLEIPNISFIAVNYPISLLQKIKRHTYFCREYTFLYDAVNARNTSYDIIWANDLPTLHSGRLLAQKFSAKLIYDAHEIYVETLNQFFPKNAPFPKSLVIKTLLSIMRKHGRSTEKRDSQHADLFITVNDSLGNYFRENYGVNQPLTIMNFPEKLKISSGKIDFRTLFSWSNEDILFIYQGVLNQGRGLSILIEALAQTPSNFKLILLGNGPLETELNSLISKLQLSEKIKMIAKVPLDQLPAYTKGADYGINLLEDLNLSKKLASPNKLFEYIQAEIPIVCSDTVENRKIITQFPVGVLTQNNPEQICESMIQITQNRAENSQKNQSVFAEAADKFAWEHQESKLLQATEELFNA